MRSGGGQPQGLPLQWACLFSGSVVTDTTNIFVAIVFSCRLSPTPPIMKMVGWTPPEMGDSRIAPTGGWPGVFSEESFMQFCGCTPWDENVCGAEAGNHKGCPYNGFAGAYFRSNRSCRLSPTPPIMKMAVRAIRESPLREVGRGYFLRNHSCSLAAAHRGMKMYAERRRATTRVAPTMGLQGLIFVAIVHVGCHRHHLNHENGGRGGSRIAPTGGWPGVFSEESFMQFCGCTPWDENVFGAEAGNHKGCPYNGFVGVLFS